MSRIHFDSFCQNGCGPVVILKGNPMICPEIGKRIEVEPLKLENFRPSGAERVVSSPIPSPSPGKEILN